MSILKQLALKRTLSKPEFVRGELATNHEINEKILKRLIISINTILNYENYLE